MSRSARPKLLPGDRSLVAYTVLAQAAAGGYLVLLLARVLLASQAGFAATRARMAPAFLAVGPLIALAVLFSLLHLGSPGNAWRAMGNLRTSWLSREILFTLLFGGGWALVTGLDILQALPPGWLLGGMAFTALAGLGLVTCMARLYRLRTVPAWDRPGTPLAFFTTTLLLGSLGAAAALAPGPALPGPLRGSLASLALVALGFAAWQERPEQTDLHREDAKAGRFRLLLAGAAALLALLSLFLSPPRLTLLGPAFILALLGEILARARFYPRRLRPEARWY